MTTPEVIIADDGAIRTIRMNRPEKKNALTAPMYDAMAEALETANTTPAVRCAVILGAPAMRTQRTPSAVPASSIAAAIASYIASVSAFFLSGRSARSG